MKIVLKLFVLTLILGLSTNLVAQTGLDKAERKKASTSLKSTYATLLQSVKGLSDEQLNFKADPESWSVAECVEHLAISEKAIFGIVQQTLQAEADPSQREMVKLSDDDILAFIQDRSTKIKTQPNLEPKNSYGSYSAAMADLKAERKKNIKYVKKTSDDLRNHFFDFPFGKVDSYQIILFMSGHTSRHTKQIEEVMANEGFPAG